MNEDRNDEKPKVEFSIYGIEFRATGKFVAKFIERHSVKILVLVCAIVALGWLSLMAWLFFQLATAMGFDLK